MKASELKGELPIQGLGCYLLLTIVNEGMEYLLRGEGNFLVS